MPHSFVTFKKNDLRLRDIDLLVTMHYLVNSLETSVNSRGHELAARFSKIFIGCAPGCLGFSMGEDELDQATINELCNALSKSKAEIESHEQVIPRQHLQRIWKADDQAIWTEDFLCKDVIKTIAQLAELTGCNCFE